MNETSLARPLPDHVDMLVVGAGISGIGLGCHLLAKRPNRTFAIVDGRDAIGGTWDLFRYPGIRSDSDLHTFGFSFKPWTSKNAIADAPEILNYLRETVEEHRLTQHIHLGHKVLSANFCRERNLWDVTIERTGDGERFSVTCRFLFSGAGYYDYDSAFTPAFDGADTFGGQIVHPQFWPEDLDYTGKKVVIIGSGATAVTLIPAMAERAAHITMLQRSPSYVFALPRKDPIANNLLRILPDGIAYRITRRININRFRLLYHGFQRYPNAARRFIRAMNKWMLPKGYAVDTHFKPEYGPWDQRLCLVPDGDMFKSISSGAASVVTDRIDRFTERGILLESGTELEADIIITATGLNLRPFGGIPLSVDGSPVNVGERMVYNAMLLEGVPNFAFVIGYWNSSWTLKLDLVAGHLCRLLDHMDRSGLTTVTPINDDPSMIRRPYFDVEAGYMQRAKDILPKQGSRDPWTVVQDYNFDRKRLAGKVDHPVLHFGTDASDIAAPIDLAQASV